MVIISIGTCIFVERYVYLFYECQSDYIFNNEYGCMRVVGFLSGNGCMGVVEYDNKYIFNNVVNFFILGFYVYVVVWVFLFNSFNI